MTRTPILTLTRLRETSIATLDRDPTPADVCLETLADDVVEMTERALTAETARDSYRLLAQQLLHALHAVTIERDILLGQRQIDRRHQRACDQVTGETPT